MVRRYPSGKLAVDTAPATPEKPLGRSPDNLVDRLGESFRTPPFAQLKAALYIRQHETDPEDGLMLARCLGVDAMYLGIRRVRGEDDE